MINICWQNYIGTIVLYWNWYNQFEKWIFIIEKNIWLKHFIKPYLYTIY